ncbi:MFS general substrate transporter [Dacryopinax primogenitus]|uniref:MFS general substrate transporter n=1 Tax=Dacryopinax primogenitus (strain DJM 731) TaxID=1858805 RepID=M5FYN1_DACPD|nr:MFS general substrate transporter [Dacryopinax primogenitus]EJT96617.1 MFS general substrate transporter [Dacryopinax primogenitus]
MALVQDSVPSKAEEAAGVHTPIQDDPGWTPQEASRVLWKVDLLLMPVLTFSYGLQFYDKFVFSSGALFGMLADLQLQTSVPGTNTMSTLRYSTATAAFYWGYIVGVLPIALLLQRLPVAKALSTLIFVWGVIVILTVTVTSFPGAVVQRFFLGLVESAVSPGFVLVSSMWYTRSELPLRLGIWYSATGLFTIFSGLINWGIGSASQTAPLPGWKYMYLFAGSLTLLWSVLLLFLLPDSPATSHRWFNEKERRILLSRMRGNLAGADSRVLKWYQVREAACDWKVWLMGAMGAAIYVCNGGVTAFGSLIIKSFGYSSLRSIVLQTPGGATTCVAIYISGFLASRYRNIRCLLLALTCLPVMAGGIIIWRASWHPPGVALFGYYLLPIFGAPYVLLLALASNNIAGGSKKACATAAVFVGYNVGNIVGPYLVNTAQAPEKYRTTWISIIVVMSFTIFGSALLAVTWARENARRDRLPPPEREEEGTEKVGEQTGRTETDFGSADGIMHVEKDRTDWENLAFRYSL